MLNSLGARFRSLRLGGIIGSCRPYPYSFVGSFVSDSIVMMLRVGDLTDDIDSIPRACVLDDSVELSTIGVLFLVGCAQLKILRRRQRSHSN